MSIASRPSDAAKASAPAAPRRWLGFSWTRLLRGLAVWLAIGVIAGLAIAKGLELRRWAWDQTERVRFLGDIYNGYTQASNAIDAGYAKIYDQIVRQRGPDQYGLDYPPLRLAIMIEWVKWMRATFPHAPPQVEQYQFAAPLLWLNTIAELASAVAIFLLVRLWVARGDLPPQRRPSRLWRWIRQAILRRPPAPPPLAAPLDVRSRPYRGWLAGLTAALLFWFNPAIIIDAHCWPQWDVWLLPFFLWAAFLASIDCWLCAGLLLATGAMIKGQILLVTPLLFLWPLFQGRIGAVLRCAIGFAAAIAAITATWLLRDPSARLWVACVTLAAALLSPWPFLKRFRWHWWLFAAIAALLVVWPFCFGQPWPLVRATANPSPAANLVIAAIFAITLLLLSRLLPRRGVPFLLAAAPAVAALLCVPLFNASTAWLEVGTSYGTRHYPVMNIGPVNNLAAILAGRYGWQNLTATVWTLDLPAIGPLPAIHEPIALKLLLSVAYGIALLLCSIGAAIHSRRNDPRFLIAIAAPWVLFFAILPQMHERYLVWASGVTAVAAGVSFGMTFLHAFISFVGWMTIYLSMLWRNPSVSPQWYRLFQRLHPDLGWAVLLTAAVFLYVAVAPRKPRPITRPAPPAN